MKPIGIFLLVALLVAGCATTHTVQVDTDYVLALSAANRFLSAWRSRNQDNGLTELSPRLLKSKGERWWRDEISGISNPHHESYEITNGRRLPGGRFTFDVWLYEYYTGEKFAPTPRWRPDKIILIRVSPGEWKVDEAPDI
jgi:hypothetical protein